jgi:uncharacterized protein YkwD
VDQPVNTAAPTHRTPRRRHRLARATALVVVAVVAATGCLSADQQNDVDLVNRERTANRLATLTVDQGAATKAQNWSAHMAATGVLEHTGGGTKLDPSGLTNWCSIGENVGKGPSIKAVHDAFMASSTHRANILGRWQRTGTGVVKKGDYYWVTEIFLRPC